MNSSGELATELEAMLGANPLPQQLGEWLALHGAQVVDALQMADDMVMIPEIDLNDMVAFVRQQAAEGS